MIAAALLYDSTVTALFMVHCDVETGEKRHI